MNLADKLMLITYQIREIQRESKFIEEINKISVKPDWTPIQKLTNDLIIKIHELDQVLAEMEKVKNESER